MIPNLQEKIKRGPPPQNSSTELEQEFNSLTSHSRQKIRTNLQEANNLETYAKNPEKIMEIKYPEGDKFLIGCFEACLQEYSVIEKKTTHDYGRIQYFDMACISKTLDNKS